MENSTVSMKLLIDTQTKRVLFAEAGKECVDFLFQILSLPVATVIRLLQTQGMEGSSLENLDHTYILPGNNKDTFFIPSSSVPVPLRALNVDHIPKCTYAYCTGARSNRLRSSGFQKVARNSSKCLSCGHNLPAAEDGGGIVKGEVTYMVMDDLVVNPMSAISSVTLLNKFNVKDVGLLEEKVVTLGMNQAVKLLKTSLQSKNVLTDVFC